MSVKVEQLPIPPMALGEGPHWLEDQQALIFVDIYAKTLHRHFIETGRHQVLHVDESVPVDSLTMVVPVEGEPDLWVVAMGKTLCMVSWSTSDPDTHTVSPVVIHSTLDEFFNDAKCDPQGRLWAGTSTILNDKAEPISVEKNGLYKFDHNLNHTKCVENVTISNGMAWSHDRKHFYYIDSHAGCIFMFDYEDTEGAISNQRVLLDYKEAGLTNQMPDGMTIDVDGNLWVASFSGSQVLCVDPCKKQVVRQVAVPARIVTSVCWGGKDYSTLFVTSGTKWMTKEELAAQPAAGGTFAITGLCTTGSPPASFKLDQSLIKSKMGQCRVASSP